MIVSVMLTTGRTVGAEQQVLGSIDSAGTRSITIRAEAEAGLTSDVLDRIASIEGIEWAGGFSAAVDATNTAIPDGSRVPVRQVYGSQLQRLGIPGDPAVQDGAAWASSAALKQLGLPDQMGGITVSTGETLGIVGTVEVPDFLAGYEPVVLVPQQHATGAESIALLIVIADRPDLVAPVSQAVRSVLGADDASMVKIQTSEELAQLRALIEGQLGSFSRSLVLALLSLTGLLVAVLLYGLVMMRRKDFGRRRALGASRGLIIGLLVTQTALLAGVGIIVGVAVSLVVLFASGDPWPGGAFTAALAILALCTALIASLIPAAVASRREPIRELRVP
ncbi:ADOP family protein [Zhihengliuella sp. ISTPL4]|uniref:FtsX-like permease family protein n=1 Tax=Zhihengliuella sp. ISTPL4 TaxID=2058657 RepID=UPI00257079A9|nr:FtsX-like permease family protein [Zhihengliuella sp. ISTPL4]